MDIVSMILPKYGIKHTLDICLKTGNFMCEHLASFREGYLPSESAQHAPKQKKNSKSHLHPDSASFELANALSKPTMDRLGPFLI
jgi:hypothetical protein